jgi:hypothetical protein
MGKSKSKIEPKSEHSARSLINQPTRMKAINNIPQTTPTPTPTPTSWLNISNSNFSDFEKQAAEHQQRQMNIIRDQEEISQKQERIKPLLVKYLYKNGYLNKKRYIISPYVMGNVFGNLPDDSNLPIKYDKNMLYLFGRILRHNINNSHTQLTLKWEPIELKIDIDELTQPENIQVIYTIPTESSIKKKVYELQTSFNTTNKLDFSRANGGKNNKKKQSKSMRSRTSTKSHKHHRKSFTLKNVK